MNKYNLPEFPSLSRFLTQQSFAAGARRKIIEMVETRCDQFGVVESSDGGGYLLDLSGAAGTPDYAEHPVSRVVYLVRPDESAAKPRVPDVPVNYLFEDWADADDWADFCLTH